MSRIIEAGHYYQTVGPTAWSALGWHIAHQLLRPGDATLLFVDDVHGAAQAHPLERVALCGYTHVPAPAYIVLESAVRAASAAMLVRLNSLSVKKRPALANGGTLFCSGAPLVGPAGEYLCTLLDLGLTLQKSRLGFDAAVNILPAFYEEQQRSLLRLLKKVLPDFPVQVILFDHAGNTTNIAQ